MKPTVSDRITSGPSGRAIRRIVGSSVAKSMSLAITSRPGQTVEQGRLAGVGIADQRHHRIGYLGPRRAVQLAGLDDLVQLPAQPHQLVVDGPPVGLDLGLAGAADEAEPAALALKVGPGAHQPGALVAERRHLDLQHALAGAGAVAEDLEDQPGAVEDLDLPGLFEIALLHRRDRPVDQHQLDLVLREDLGQLLDLARAEQHAPAAAWPDAPPAPPITSSPGSAAASATASSSAGPGARRPVVGFQLGMQHPGAGDAPGPCSVKWSSSPS